MLINNNINMKSTFFMYVHFMHIYFCNLTFIFSSVCILISPSSSLECTNTSDPQSRKKALTLIKVCRLASPSLYSFQSPIILLPSVFPLCFTCSPLYKILPQWQRSALITLNRTIMHIVWSSVPCI